jgi:Flp pilus assembly protein TadD
MPQMSLNHAFQLAIGHQAAGRLREAEAIYRQILAVRPSHADSLHLLGVIAGQRDDNAAAVEWIGKAIAIEPSAAIYHNNLGAFSRRLGKMDEALAAYKKAVELQPDYADARYNLGNVLRDTGLLEQSIAEYREAIRLRPDNAETHNNFGFALQHLGRVEEAIAEYREAMRLKPHYADVHLNLAFALLVGGDYEQGLPEYEWRTRRPAHGLAELPQPRWDGGTLQGKTILVRSEQGLGDGIQFVRYVAILADRGGAVILECLPELRRLFEGVAGVTHVLARGEPPPPFDVHCPLASLPLALGTRLDSIPAAVPYLHADSRLVEASGIAVPGGALNVGLAWAGNPDHRNDRNRSLSLARLSPLGAAKDVRFFSLQKGKPAEQVRTPPPGMELVDASPELTDFADSAALIARLDLLITVDTAVAHLAGAMGKEVWVLLPFAPDWRWLLGREDSPWYPTMRLFRQETPGEWGPVIERVVMELERINYVKASMPAFLRPLASPGNCSSP